MALQQEWRISYGDASSTVTAENWLAALAAGLPAVGLSLGALGRLVCAMEADGSATARDPQGGAEVRVVPVGAALPPGFDMPESSFASLNAAHLRVPAPTPGLDIVEDSEPSLFTVPDDIAEIAPVAEEPVAPAPAPEPLDDRLEDLFMLLGEINEAPSPREACVAALRIVNQLVPADAGAVLVRARNGAGLRFNAASGPAAASVEGTLLPEDRGIAGFVYSLGIGLVVEDVKRDNRHYSKVDRSTGYTTRAVLAVPVRGDAGGRFGCLELINPSRRFNDDDLELASRVAVTLGNYLRAMDE